MTRTWKTYVTGWNAGIESETSGDFMLEKPARGIPLGFRKAILFNETRTFKTREQAEKAIRSQPLASPASKRFIRVAAWETWRDEKLPLAPENWCEKIYVD